MKDTQLYSQILGIVSPWLVDSVNLSLLEQTVTVTVSFSEGHQFGCPVCGKVSPRYDRRTRRWRHLDTCQLQTTIEADIPRVNCTEHGIHQIQVPWAEEGSRLTSLFESLVISWLKVAPLSSVASRLNLDWDTVHGIQHRAVQRGLKRRESIAPTNITIDETSEKKGHKYLTIVSEGSRVLYVKEGRDRAAIDGFYEGLSPHALANIRSISMDLWPAYSGSSKVFVPNAEEKICLDRFHVAVYFNKALDSVRRQEHRELMAIGDTTLKGTKYEWLCTSEKVDNRSRRSFSQIAHSALKTAKAWAMKETAHNLWNFIYSGVALKAWKQLLRWMSRSQLVPMSMLAKSLKRHLWMILNAVRLKATSGCAEGNNSRIQKVKKMACGFRNTENFKNSIYFHLGGLDLVPHIVTT